MRSSFRLLLFICGALFFAFSFFFGFLLSLLLIRNSSSFSSTGFCASIRLLWDPRNPGCPTHILVRSYSIELSWRFAFCRTLLRFQWHAHHTRSIHQFKNCRLHYPMVHVQWMNSHTQRDALTELSSNHTRAESLQRSAELSTGLCSFEQSFRFVLKKLVLLNWVQVTMAWTLSLANSWLPANWSRNFPYVAHLR